MTSRFYGIMMVGVGSRRATPGISKGAGRTPPCEPLTRLLGGANVVDTANAAIALTREL